MLYVGVYVVLLLKTSLKITGQFSATPSCCFPLETVLPQSSNAVSDPFSEAWRPTCLSLNWSLPKDSDCVTSAIISLKREAQECLPSALWESLLQALEEACGSCPFLLPDWGLPLHQADTHRKLDLLGPVGILEGVVSVLICQAGGADGSNHYCAAVAPDGILEQTGQFAVPIGHMRLATLGDSEQAWGEVVGLDRPDWDLAASGPGLKGGTFGFRYSVAVLWGTLGLCSCTFASARALRTLMRASRERLMLAPSRSRSPFAWVLDARSEPARSIRLILATRRAWVRPGTRSCCFTKIWGQRARVRGCWASEALSSCSDL